LLGPFGLAILIALIWEQIIDFRDSVLNYYIIKPKKFKPSEVVSLDKVELGQDKTQMLSPKKS
jgi:hypothetical protein